MKIFCGLCGSRHHQLLTHLRNAHEMSPDKYKDRCPGAPLISEDLAAYIHHSRIVATEDEIRKQVDLFGVGFLTDILPGELVPKVDDDYVLQEELCRQVLISLKAGEKILLVGPTGTGKSTLIEQLASRLNWPMIRVAASGGLAESDLLGEWTVCKSETVFNYGFLPRAMKTGAICLIDEIDGIEPSVAFSIHQLMEDQGKLVLLQNGGELIEPHRNFRLVTTANTLGHGDETGMYTGTRVLNEAFLDRFAAIIRVSYMPPEIEAEIICRRVPDCSKSLARKLGKVATDVRKARENDEIYCTLSTRRLIDLARKHSQLNDLASALELAVLNRLADSDRQVVFEIAQRHFGNILNPKGAQENEKQST